MNDELLKARGNTPSDRARVLVLADYYLPGFKAGGPIRSLANMVDRLGDEFTFKIVTRDRDAGEAKPYRGIVANAWQPVGKARVLYLSPSQLGAPILRRVIADGGNQLVYLNSFFSPVFTIQTLLLRKLGLLGDIPVLVAPRGEFSPSALRGKAWKKRSYIPVAKALALYSGVIWQASSSSEEEDLRRCIGAQANVRVAPNIAEAVPDLAQVPRLLKVPGKLCVLFIARIAKHKNLAFALRTLRRVAGEIEFNIYGPLSDHLYWRQCEELISKLPENIRAKYYGSLGHDQVFDALRRHHLFFLPTLSENFGHAIAEALLAGCPVLISDQTPWRNLEQRCAGWDVPLSRQDRFQQILRRCVEMDQATFDQWSAGAQRVAASGLDSDGLEKNRALLRTALSTSGFGHEARRVVG
jgi:glycosyltransferase involved in cell wall biosynthesis